MPVPCLSSEETIALQAGEQFSLALTSSGNVYAWGRGKEAAMGNGTRTPNELPALVTALSPYTVVAIAAGNQHWAALDARGRLFLTGRLHRYTGQAEEVVFGLAFNVSARRNATVAMVKESSLLYYAGGNAEAAEEVRQSNSFGSFMPYLSTVPTPVPGFGGVDAPPDRHVVSVACGYSYTIFATADGSLWSMGFNEVGQLGLGHRFNQEKPVRVPLPGKKVVRVATGQQHSVAITSDGQVFTFGLGIFGALGHGNFQTLLRPKRITSLATQCFVVDAQCGSHFTLLRTALGRILMFGHSEFGQFGGDNQFDDWEAGGSGVGAETDEAQLAAELVDDAAHLDKLRAVHMWTDQPTQGDDESSEELDEETERAVAAATGYDSISARRMARATHTRPRVPPGLRGRRMLAMACGALHVLVIDEQHQVYSYGWNSGGALGVGDRKYRLTPTKVPALSGYQVSGVAAGWKHSLFLTTNNESSFAMDFLPLAAESTIVGAPSILRRPTQDAILRVRHGRLITDMPVHEGLLLARAPHLAVETVFESRWCVPVLLAEAEADAAAADEEETGRLAVPRTRARVFHLSANIGVAKALVRYLYTDHLISPPHLIRRLHRVAVRLRLPRLATLCTRAGLSRGAIIEVPPSAYLGDMEDWLKLRDTSDDEQEVQSADVEFVVDGTCRLRAHRAFLAARSEYFATLFGSGFAEGGGPPDSDTGRRPITTVTVPDIHPDTFRLLLAYAYTGHAERLLTPATAIDLLSAATRFLLPGLKRAAERFLIDFLDDDNVYWLLPEADELQALKLRQACVEVLALQTSEQEKEHAEDVAVLESRSGPAINEARALRATIAVGGK
jgi:alpha-tubulin suppressor-like RCC1 family protein